MLRLPSKLLRSRSFTGDSSFKRPLQPFATVCSGTSRVFRDDEPKQSELSDSIRRHVGPSKADVQAMLEVIGVSDLTDLLNRALPSSILQSKVHGEKTSSKGLQMNSIHQSQVVSEMEQILSSNEVRRGGLGLGFCRARLPSPIQRHILESPGWYTAYTPYQPEISQGRLEALANFQTMVCELTGSEVTSASLLDEGTAAAEAMTMLRAINKGKKTDRRKVLVSSSLHPCTIAVLSTRAKWLGLQLELLPMALLEGLEPTYDALETLLSKDDCLGYIYQFPDTFGKLHRFESILELLSKYGCPKIACVDPLSLCLFKPPGEVGADISIGSLQRFGLPLGFGGPHPAFLATRDIYKRFIPGRIVAMSVDSRGNPAYRMALQTREQHIRRQKATSNICTAQALLATMASMFGVYHGPEGLREIALGVLLKTHTLRSLTATIQDIRVVNGAGAFFDTLTLQTLGNADARAKCRSLGEAGYNARQLDKTLFCVSLDEVTTFNDVVAMSTALGHSGDTAAVKEDLLADGVLKMVETGATDEQILSSSKKELLNMLERDYTSILRTSSFMKQDVFNKLHSETAFMRYAKRLERKDFGLDFGMIPLGSCTMKLNPACSLTSLMNPKLTEVHPYAPASQTRGYLKMLTELGEMLKALTGMSSCSFQPNSGAAGEYAGLTTIRSYHESRGEAQRVVCLIPESAHGTNFASAAAAGLRVVPVSVSLDNGSVDLDRLQELVKKHKSDLCCLMITYPSTFGKYDANVQEVCQIVHDAGGQVYFDGANFNALLGIATPAQLGADVCHLNLHKTFSIPHGGGGPGAGPILAKEPLAPFLPRSIDIYEDDYRSLLNIEKLSALNQVASSPFGSAWILSIPYVFIKSMGLEGLKMCTELAVLNANYMAARLKEHYCINFVGPCAHEFIIDVGPLTKSSGVTEADIAKRLIDYSFHAPTMSWPLKASLMIEPTESEPKAEIDRFCDAMIAIRGEIAKVENGTWNRNDNPLCNAPHTLEEVTSDFWSHPYSREIAAYPAGRSSVKFWPSVARLNDAHGDKHFFCACGSV